MQMGQFILPITATPYIHIHVMTANDTLLHQTNNAYTILRNSSYIILFLLWQNGRIIDDQKGDFHPLTPRVTWSVYVPVLTSQLIVWRRWWRHTWLYNT